MLDGKKRGRGFRCALVAGGPGTLEAGILVLVGVTVRFLWLVQVGSRARHWEVVVTDQVLPVLDTWLQRL